MCQLMDTPSWSSLWQGICFRAKLPESCCRTTAEQQQLTLARILSRPTQVNRDYLPQTPKKIDFGSKLEAKKIGPKNEAIFGFA